MWAMMGSSFSVCCVCLEKLFHVSGAGLSTNTTWVRSSRVDREGQIFTWAYHHVGQKEYTPPLRPVIIRGLSHHWNYRGANRSQCTRRSEKRHAPEVCRAFRVGTDLHRILTTGYTAKKWWRLQEWWSLYDALVIILKKNSFLFSEYKLFDILRVSRASDQKSSMNTMFCFLIHFHTTVSGEFRWPSFMWLSEMAQNTHSLFLSRSMKTQHGFGNTKLYLSQAVEIVALVYESLNSNNRTFKTGNANNFCKNTRHK